jgi:hypothetical protein
MTTAYAQRASYVALPPTLRPRQWASGSAPAQGREALKVRANVHAIGLGTTATQGHSVESEALKATIRAVVSSIETFYQRLQGMDDTGYNHVPLKPAFTVKATYKRIGKLPARQLPEVE